MDKFLKEIQFYKQYPEYLPFIGNDFSRTGILLLGESHFWSSEHTANQDPEKWYQSGSTDLTDGEKSSINIRAIIGNFRKNKSRSAVFGKIDKALKEANYPQGIQSVAFMNTFQRPAVGKGNSIKRSISEIDIKKSTEVINKVVKIIKPQHICFVSKLSYKKISKEINFGYIDVVVHPASAWWNRETKKGNTGKELFGKLLQKYGEK